MAGRWCGGDWRVCGSRPFAPRGVGMAGAEPRHLVATSVGRGGFCGDCGLCAAGLEAADAGLAPARSDGPVGAGGGRTTDARCGPDDGLLDCLIRVASFLGACSQISNPSSRDREEAGQDQAPLNRGGSSSRAGHETLRGAWYWPAPSGRGSKGVGSSLLHFGVLGDTQRFGAGAPAGGSALHGECST